MARYESPSGIVSHDTAGGAKVRWHLDDWGCDGCNTGTEPPRR
ncbi:hypothetical protein [Acrocarpospora sp. B8E8]